MNDFTDHEAGSLALHCAAARRRLNWAMYDLTRDDDEAAQSWHAPAADDCEDDCDA